MIAQSRSSRLSRAKTPIEQERLRLALAAAVGGGQRELGRGGHQRRGIGAIGAQPLQWRALPVARARSPGFERGEGEPAQARIRAGGEPALDCAPLLRAETVLLIADRRAGDQQRLVVPFLARAHALEVLRRGRRRSGYQPASRTRSVIVRGSVLQRAERRAGYRQEPLASARIVRFQRLHSALEQATPWKQVTQEIGDGRGVALVADRQRRFQRLGGLTLIPSHAPSGATSGGEPSRYPLS